MDSPWERLPWTLPGALFLSLASLFVFLWVLGQPPRRGLRSTTLDARIVEIPGPPGGARPASGPPPPAKPPEEHVPQHPVAHVLPKPPPERVKREPKPTSEATEQPSPPSQNPESAPAHSAEGSQPSGTPGGGLAGGNLSARALFKPLPEIPDEVRRQQAEIVAVARFAVAADGSSHVELIQPTQDPALNRSLLEALGRWRFFPAIEDGKPVASSVDIRIPISVR